ncbi:MAG: Gfo/Idh/MocA family oxidoreductase [Armatimonadetes bacterium]|nr:Gfo/Idh/MocA family oxidoreductase [Armatimonadota bacterium]
MSYRVALIGAGTMGGVHAGHWKTMPGAELVAVVDPRTDAAAAHGAPFSDFDTMLAQAKPDIVDVCTPTPFHREYVEKAAAAGKAIFVEKPFARSLSDCDAMLAAVTRAGVPAMSGHVLRYFPEYAGAKRLVDAGAVGTPVAARTARMAGLPDLGGRPNWYADPAQSGGVVLDMILHDFDWLRWTLGEVTRVYGKGLFHLTKHTGVLDYALVTLRFASGAVAHVTGSWAHPGGFRTTLEIAGNAGLIEHDSARTAPLTASLRTKGGGGGVAVPESPMAQGQDPYYQEIAAFVHALQAGETPPVTLADARAATRIALAALESIETGKVVTLS